MTKPEVEAVFKTMDLCYSRAHDFWFFPPHIAFTHQFAIRSLINQDVDMSTVVQVRISYPDRDQWYYPDQAIKRVQAIIYEIFEYYAEERDKTAI